MHNRAGAQYLFNLKVWIKNLLASPPMSMKINERKQESLEMLNVYLEVIMSIGHSVCLSVALKLEVIAY